MKQISMNALRILTMILCTFSLQANNFSIESPNGDDIVIVEVNTTNPSCGTASGSIEIIANSSSGAATTGYSYGIYYNTQYQTSNLFTGLNAGSYAVNVIDAAGCMSDIVMINLTDEEARLNVVGYVECNLDASISIDAMVSGGSAAYQFSWTGPNGFTANTEDLIAVPAGSYDLVVTDMTGCTGLATFGLDECTANRAAFCDAVVNNPECVGETNGSIIVSPTGGSAPYTYNWGDLPPGSAANFRSGLSAGDYFVTISDGTGAEETCQFTLIAPTQMVLDDIDITQPSCLDGDGTVVFNVTPSVTSSGALLYSIESPVNFVSSNTFTNVPSGDYFVFIRDEFGCQIDAFITLTPEDNGMVATSDGNCLTADEVWIDVSVAGGVSPFSYEWEEQTTGTTYNMANVQNIPVGIYVVTVTDAEGCTASTNISLTNCCTIDNLCNGTVTNATCGESNGGVISAPLTSQTPVTYAWQHDPTLTTGVATNLSAGIYRVTITDASGCGKQCTFVVEESSGVSLDNSNVSVLQPTCGLDNGQINITASTTDPTCALEYSIDGGNTYVNSTTFNGLTAGMYVVAVRDCNGCSAMLGVDLNSSDGPSIQFNSSMCTATGGIDVDVSVFGGASPFSYSWTGPQAFATEDLANAPQGTYTLVVTDANNCTAQSDAITQTGCAVADLCANSSFRNPVCRGDANGEIQLSPVGGVAPITYNWSHDASLSGPLATNLTAGNYRVTISDAAGVTSECEFSLDDPDSYFVFDYNSSDPNCGVNDGSLELLLGVTTGTGSFPVSGSGTGVMYSVDGGSNYSSNPFFPNLPTGSFNLVVIDASGCSSEIVVANLAEEGCNDAKMCGYVWVDANGDGVQDNFETGVPGAQVQLYDQFGTLVATTVASGSGEYTFDGLAGGNYFIRVVLPSGYSATFPNAGGSDLTDSDVDHSNGPNTTALINLSSGECDCTVDVGIYKCSEVGDLVWLDFNHNGVQDTDENGINGVKVNLYRLFGNDWVLYDSQYTGHKPGTPSDDGYYKFCAAPGSYYVEFEANPNNLTVVGANQAPDEFDSDVTGQFGPGTTHQFELGSNDMNCDIDAGYIPSSSLGNRAWVDNNRDGMQNNNEPGLSNVQVELRDVTGSVIMTTTTDTNGEYEFEDLVAGTYSVRFVPPSSFSPTFRDMGTDDEADSDINANMVTNMLNLELCEINKSVDAGFVQGVVLPVEWISFDGENRGNYNALNWETANEINNDHFVVERRINNDTEFEAISKIPATELVQSINAYSFDDYDLFVAGDYYYRLKQVDELGTYNYSNIIHLVVDQDVRDVFEMGIYPNPTSALINVSFYSDTEAQASVQIYDIVGELVIPSTITKEIFRGENILKVDVTDLPQGVYTVNVRYGGRVISDNFVKL